jgi:hypothetical protein
LPVFASLHIPPDFSLATGNSKLDSAPFLLTFRKEPSYPRLALIWCPRMGKVGRRPAPMTFRIQDTSAEARLAWATREGEWWTTCALWQIDIRAVGDTGRKAELRASNWPSVWQRQLKKWYNYGAGHSRDARRGIK